MTLERIPEGRQGTSMSSEAGSRGRPRTREYHRDHQARGRYSNTVSERLVGGGGGGFLGASEGYSVVVLVVLG